MASMWLNTVEAKPSIFYGNLLIVLLWLAEIINLVRI